MKAEEKRKDGLSGKYYFHSLYKNIGAYIREPGEVEGYSQDQFILVYKGGYWFIMYAFEDDEMFGGDFLGGIFRIATEGNKKFFWTSEQGHSKYF